MKSTNFGAIIIFFIIWATEVFNPVFMRTLTKKLFFGIRLLSRWYEHAKAVNEYNKTNPEYKVKNVSLTEADMYLRFQQLLILKGNTRFTDCA